MIIRTQPTNITKVVETTGTREPQIAQVATIDAAAAVAVAAVATQVDRANTVGGSIASTVFHKALIYAVMEMNATNTDATKRAITMHRVPLQGPVEKGCACAQSRENKQLYINSQ